MEDQWKMGCFYFLEKKKFVTFFYNNANGDDLYDLSVKKLRDRPMVESLEVETDQ